MNKYITTVDGKQYEVEAARVESVPGQGRITFYDDEGGVVASFVGSSINFYKDTSVTVIE